MNAIDKAITDVKFRIPRPVLERAFDSNNDSVYGSPGGFKKQKMVSIDQRIKERVIQARVFEDCNLSGGSETNIYIGDINPHTLPDYKMVWRIPLEKTENRHISKVFNLSYGVRRGHTAGAISTQVGSSMVGAVQELLNSHTVHSDTVDAQIELVGANTVMSRSVVPRTGQLYLRCVLENDEEFNNLPPSAIRNFSKLVVWAVKSYVYQQLILEIDQGRLSGGSELGRFTSVVEGYADAEDNYQEMLEGKWAKTQFMSDPVAYKRSLSRLVGPGR